MLHSERVKYSLAHQTADRPPKGEILIDNDFLDIYMPNEKDRHVACLALLDEFNLDLISEDLTRPVPQKIGTAPSGRPVFEDCWGVRFEYAKDSLHYCQFPITDSASADTYNFPDPGIYTAEKLARWKNETDRYVCAIIGGTFDNLVPLIGFDTLMMWSIQAPDALEKLAWKAARFNLGLAKIAAASGVDMLIVADDIAYNSGTFISPVMLRQLFFPALKWLVAEIHNCTNCVCFMHTDGNINAVMDDIVDCGFDGLQSLQPSAGMDIRAVKKKYGDNLCLMGNIDLDYLQPRGTKEQIQNEVKNLARDIGRDGGWILSTCNTLSRAVPFDAAKAMYDAIEL